MDPITKERRKEIHKLIYAEDWDYTIFQRIDTLLWEDKISYDEASILMREQAMRPEG